MIAAIKVAGIAVIKPSMVVTRASEIPFAIVFGSPVPNKVIAWKVLIIPVMVPNNPNKGATTEINLTNQIPVSIDAVSYTHLTLPTKA